MVKLETGGRTRRWASEGLNSNEIECFLVIGLNLDLQMTTHIESGDVIICPITDKY